MALPPLHLHTVGGPLPGARDLVTLAVVVAVMTVAACQVALALLERRRLSPATVIPATVWLG
ncbi:MAG: hypothetical protein ACHQ02_08170, partial [Candidatus Limnocylindrales bacterium]